MRNYVPMNLDAQTPPDNIGLFVDKGPQPNFSFLLR